MEVVCHRHFIHSPITSSTSTTPTTSPPTPNESKLFHPPTNPKIKTEDASPSAPSPLIAASKSQPSPLAESDNGSTIKDTNQAATATTTGGNNTTNGMVECPKCDLILGSSRSLGGHMTMMHSRNSCKTLKCPKCNWHYKYQETLEIHMKEKHPASDGNTCTYCLNKEPHPRLARGENYSCGYKPYKCEICNYSTTTKGNLSIHMQSDKHANNVHELQMNQKKGPEPGVEPSTDANLRPVSTFGSKNNVGDAADSSPRPVLPGIHGSLKRCSSEHTVTSLNHNHNNHHSHLHQSPKFPDKMNRSPLTTSPFLSTSIMNTAPQDVESYEGCVRNMVGQIKPKRRCRLCGFEAITIRDLRRHMAAGIHQTSSHYLPPPPILTYPTNNNQLMSHTLDGSGTKLTDQFNTINHDEQFCDKHIKLNDTSTSGDYTYKTDDDITGQKTFYRNTDIYGNAIDDPEDSPLNYRFKDKETSLEFLDSQILEYLHRCQSLHTVTVKFKSGLYQSYKNMVSHLKSEAMTTKPPICPKVEAPHQFLNGVYGCAICYNFSTTCLKGMEDHINEFQSTRARPKPKLTVGHYTDDDGRRGEDDDDDANYRNQLDSYLRHIKQGDPDNEWQMVYLSGVRGKGSFKNQLTIHCNLCELYFQTLAEAEVHEFGPGHAIHSILIDVLTDKFFERIDHHGSDSNRSSPEPRTGEEPHTLTTTHPTTFSDYYVRCTVHSLNFLTTLALVKHVASGALFSNSSPTLADIERNHRADAGTPKDLSRVKPTPFTIHDCRLERVNFDRCGTEELSLLSFKEFHFEEPFGGRERSGGTIGTRTNHGCEDDIHRALAPGDMLAKSSMLEMALTKPVSNHHPFQGYSDGNASNYTKLFAHFMSSRMSSNLSSQLKGELCDSNVVNGYYEQEEMIDDHVLKKYNSVADSLQKMFLLKSFSPTYPKKSRIKIGGPKSIFSREKKMKLIKTNNYNMPLSTIRKNKSLVSDINQKDLSILPNYSQQLNRKNILSTNKKIRRTIAMKKRIRLICPQCSMLFHKASILRSHITRVHAKGINLHLKETKRSKVISIDHESRFGSHKYFQTHKKEIDQSNDLEKKNCAVANNDIKHSEPYTHPLPPHMSEFDYRSFSTFFNYLTALNDKNGSENSLLCHDSSRSAALEKFLDPTRPYKCGVCRESFTQKNILLVHYNSVSHLHRLKRSLFLQNLVKPPNEPTNPTLSGEYGDNLHKFETALKSPVSDVKNIDGIRIMEGTCSLKDGEKQKFRHASNLKQELAVPKLSRDEGNGGKETSCVSNKTSNVRTNSQKHLSPTFDFALANIGIEMVKDYDASERRLLLELVNYESSGNGLWFNCKRCSSDTSPKSCKNQSVWKLRDHLENVHGYVIGDDAIGSFLGDIRSSCTESYLVSNDDAVEDTTVGVHADNFSPTSSWYKRKLVEMLDAGGGIEDSSKGKHNYKKSLPRADLPDKERRDKSKFCAASSGGTSFIRAHHGDPGVKDTNITLNSTSGKNDKDITLPTPTSSNPFNEPRATYNNQPFPFPLFLSPNDITSMKMMMSKPYQTDSTTPVPQSHHLSAPHLPYNFNAGADYLFPYMAAAQGMTPSPFYPPHPTPSHFMPFGMNPNHHHSMGHAMPPYFFYPPSSNPGVPSDFFDAAAAAFYNFYYGSPSSSSSMVPPPPMLPMTGDGACGNESGHFGTFPNDRNDKFDRSTLSAYPSNESSCAPGMAGAGNAPLDSMNPNFYPQQLANGKRARTRINDDQLKILRANFDINNSPTEEQIKSMSERSCLPQKVIKHWFRNTLFKERQRNKDSPYNFNNPPLTKLPISMSIDAYGNEIIYNTNCDTDYKEENESVHSSKQENLENSAVQEDIVDMVHGHTPDICLTIPAAEEKAIPKGSLRTNTNLDCIKKPGVYDKYSHIYKKIDFSKASENEPHNDVDIKNWSAHRVTKQEGSNLEGDPPLPKSSSPPAHFYSKDDSFTYSHLNMDSMSDEHMRLMTSADLAAVACGGRRANRTRFSDTQIRILQEYFERNAYPKDDELDKLSKVLGLSPRVIVVWFQNARQKARKHYETNAGYNFDLPSSISPHISTNHHSTILDNSSSVSNHNTDETNANDVRMGDFSSGELEARRDNNIYTQSEDDSNDFYQQSDDGMDEPQTAMYPIHTNECHQRSNGLKSNVKDNDCKVAHERVCISDISNNIKIEPKDDALLHSSTLPYDMRHMKYGPGFLPHDLTVKCEGREHEFRNDNRSEFKNGNQENDINYFPRSFLESNQTISLKSERSHSADSTKLMENYDINSRYSPETVTSNQASTEENGSKKRLRTNISPEQLLYLHRHYQIESNPSKLIMEKIAKDIGLKKRVVQVWFQNARARDKKSALCPYPTATMITHNSNSVTSTGKLACSTIGSTPKSTKRCPFCNMFFRARSLLELHVKIKHPSQYADFEAVMPAPSTSSSSTSLRIDLPSSGNSNPKHCCNESGEEGEPYNHEKFDFLREEESYSPYDMATRTTKPCQDSFIDLNARQVSKVSPKKMEKDKFLGFSYNQIDSLSTKASDHHKELETPLDLSKPAHVINSNSKDIEVSSTQLPSYKEGCEPFEAVPKVSYEPPSLETDENDIVYKDKHDVDNRRKLLRSQNSQLLDLMMNQNPNNNYFNNSSKGYLNTQVESDTGNECENERESPLPNMNSESTTNGQYVLSTLSAVAASCGSSLANTKRYRTQMNNFQVACMKQIFNDYKTPTMTECEILGIKIGLPKRVIQVWFQNARAKEKKSKYGYIRTSQGIPTDQEWKNATDCKLCDVKYSASYLIQDHVFTDAHLAKIKKISGDWDFPSSSIPSPFSQTPSSKHSSPYLSNTNIDQSPSPLSSEHSKSSYIWENNNGGKMTGSGREDIQRLKENKKMEKADTGEKVISNGVEHSSGKSENESSTTLKYLNYLYNNMFVPTPSQIPFHNPVAPPFFNMTDNNSFASNDFNNYDPLIHGTPLGLLQISPNVLHDIQQILYTDSEFMVPRFVFTQDGSTKNDLLEETEEVVEEVTAEVGFVCRRCLVVYPSEKACKDHVTQYCRYPYPTVPYHDDDDGDRKEKLTILILVQRYYKCQVCYAYLKKESPLQTPKNNCSDQHNFHFSTANDFNNHCKNSNLHGSNKAPNRPPL